MQLREAARRRLPRVAFDFVDGGADDEVTLRRNRSAFDDLALIPRVLRGVGEVTVETELFGQSLRMPVLLTPAGAPVMAGANAYTAAARGATAAGTISVLTSSGDVELVAQSTDVPQWYQLYLNRDRDRVADSLERVKRLGYSALVLTADVPVAGNRERDLRNGMTVPLRLVTPRIVFDAARRPRWLRAYFSGGIRGRVREVTTLAEAVRSWIDPDQDWEAVRWLRSVWEGPLLVKGVMCAEDAKLAVDAGCDGVIVSNHGGRQLDGVPGSIEALPEIVAALDGHGQVLLDSGVRRGTDVVKALALGAKACLIGRPWIFAAVTGGEAGVTRMLEQFREEIVRTLQLLGCASLDELSPEFLRHRPTSAWERIESRSSV
jgi:isopentenyl diphosphate isomerase/L-lactate dehydrogenase-like FMN-dependent dehydrogenase